MQSGQVNLSGAGAMRLKQAELKAVHKLIEDCYAHCGEASFDQFIHRIIRKLGEVIPSEQVTYNEMYPGQGKSFNWASSNELSTPEAGKEWENVMDDHPILHYIASTGDLRAAKISSFWERNRFHDRKLYVDFYRKFRVEDALCVGLSSNDGCTIGIGWYRDRKFNRRDLETVNLLLPHIGQAWRNAKVLEGLRSELTMLGRGMDEAGISAVICDRAGKIKIATRRARENLLEYFNLQNGTSNQLPDDLLRWMRVQGAEMSGSEIPFVRTPLLAGAGAKRLSVRMLSQGESILLLFDEQTIFPAAEELTELGLTKRETEVLLWAGQGKSNAEIGAILNLRIPTVKKHLEHIFLKLGVENRTSAAAIAHDLVFRTNGTKKNGAGAKQNRR
jgi:DNA-binding CsgD family transcriptional regulator